MISNIPTNWKQVIQKYDDQQTTNFETFMKHERLKFQDVLDIYPRDEDIFRCFRYFDVNETKKVIIGQDPYHGKDQATGLCFDINPSAKVPPSLRNITKVLGKTPDFESWATSGTLLLNSSLSVLQGKPGTHMKYWLPFTKHIIQTINDECSEVDFIVWGAFALQQVENVDTSRHNLYISSHPSPLSFSKPMQHYPSFEKSDIFNKVSFD